VPLANEKREMPIRALRDPPFIRVGDFGQILFAADMKKGGRKDRLW
jgi:hypothetical protein